MTSEILEENDRPLPGKTLQFFYTPIYFPNIAFNSEFLCLLIFVSDGLSPLYFKHHPNKQNGIKILRYGLKPETYKKKTTYKFPDTKVLSPLFAFHLHVSN
ncbi:hypothetical protein CEXT_363961 [Caerostris extrusa]|uniref:Uncharacterized protein n=1 Tax=Caerostris extrusa TaxID=172846 RepID=A0AAV4NV33_CAEEX|nr:hypothetical protein CEXT_363961 [Caerostris extrusa]